MSKETSKILRYGQIVRIQGILENKLKGVICSKGFTDKTVNFLTYENFTQINNYRESLFQLLPRGSFEIHDEFIKMHPNEKKQNETLRQRLKTEIEQYFIMIQTKMNEDILFGAEVIFKHVESEAYLMCSDQCSDFRTDSFKLELSTQLTSSVIFKIQPFHNYQQEGQSIHFDEPLRILAETQKFWIDSVKGKQIFIDETIQLDSNTVQIGMDSISFDQCRPQMRRVSKNSQRFEAVVSHNGKECWKFKLHENFDTISEKTKLKPYDFCVFKFTNNNSYLSVDMFTSKLFLKQNKDSNNQYISLDSIWEIQPQFQKQSNQEDAIQIKSVEQLPFFSTIKNNSNLNQQDMLKKSKLMTSIVMQQNSTVYVLRHFLTGKVLTVSDQNKDLVYLAKIEDIDLNSKDQLFELQPAKKGQNQLNHGSFVKIVYNGFELQQLSSESKELEFLDINLKVRRSLTGIESFYKRLQETDLDYKTFQVGLTNSSSPDAFALHKISDEMKFDLLFALSAQEWLIQFVDILKLPPKEVEVRFTSKVLSKIILIIKQLIRYVLNIGEDENVENSEALPMMRRQRTLKDLFIVEILIEIFFFISYKNGLESLFKYWKNEKEKIKQIFKLSYCLIGKIIKGNPQIKLHVSQWLELFLHQAMMIDDINVQSSLAELLDNNYYAIQRFISRNSIKRIVEIMKGQIPHEKYLKILSSICVCKGKSITNNQIYCLNLFYQQISFEFRFQFKRESQRIMVLSHISKQNLKWRTFKNFYYESLQTDELQSWNYFLAYFNLLSDICINRNRQTKKFVDENFPLDILCCIIEDEENMKINATEPFMKCILVIHFAYIDCYHYPNIRRIARVHEWKVIEVNIDILRTPSEDKHKPENCDVKRVMEILVKFLVEFTQLSIKDKAYSNNLFTVLQVLKSTITLGFWKSIKDLQDILHNLLRICSCLKEFLDFSEAEEEANNNEAKDSTVSRKLSIGNLKTSLIMKPQYNEYYLKQQIKSTKKKLTKLNLENMILMQCKMLACDIIDLIFDIETNVRITKATFIFKKLLDSLGEGRRPSKKLLPSLSEITKLASPEAPHHSNSSKSSQSTFQAAIQSTTAANRKSRSSVIYQMIEKTQQQQDKESQNEPSTNLNMLQNMANMFKKGISEQDKSFYDITKWINEFRELINLRNLFSQNQGQSIELIFAELSLYENPEMPTFALSILNRIYGQRRELVQNFEKVIIVAEGQTYELFQETKIIGQKLQFIADRNILSATYDNQKDLNVYIWKPGQDLKDSGIIQDLHYLSSSLKREQEKLQKKNHSISIQIENLNSEKELISPYTEMELNHRLHQSLVKAQELHIPILQFIEFCSMENQLLLKLLHQAYLFLTLIIWNHMDNKMEFLKYKASMYQHIPLNVGVIDFLKELFTNNKPLLFSEREIPLILNHVVSACDKIPPSKYYKSKLLDFLRVLIVFNSKAIRTNQLLVLQKLQDSNYHNIMVSFNFRKGKEVEESIDESPRICSLQSYDQSVGSQDEASESESASSHSGNKKDDILFEEKRFEEWIAQYQATYERNEKEKSQKMVEMNANLTYLQSYFQLFSLLVEDNNEINSEKCKQMHAFQDLVMLLSKCKSCWPLKRHLRAYINRLYYRSNDYENISQYFVEIDIYNILSDLQEIIDIKTDEELSPINQTKIANPIRFSYLISYVYLTLEEILITLNLVFNNERFLLDLEEILTQNFQGHILQTHLQLFEIATKLSQLQYFYQEQKYISHFCKVLMNIFRSIFKTFDISLLLIREGLFNSALQMTSVTERFTIIQRKIAGDQIIEENTQVIERGSGPSDIIEQGKEQLPEDIDVDLLKQKLIDNVFNFQQSSDQSKHTSRRRTLQVIKMFQNKKQPEKPPEEDINEILNHRHKRLMNILNLSSQFQQFLEEEFLEVCSKISNIGEESKRIYQLPFEVTTAKEFISNIIQMNINNPGFLRDDLRVFFLKMLSRLVSEKNLKNKEQMMPIDQWTSDHWSDFKQEIEKTQNFLDECGAAELIYQTFREPQLELRLNLTTECLGFTIAFLLGGNTQCQNSLLALLKKDAQNTVLNNFALIIRKISRVVYNNFQIKVDKDSESSLFHVQTVDNFDFYDQNQRMMKRYNVIEPDDAKETAFKKQCLDLLCRFFRVLQLMCENNNVNMKRFIRQQTDLEDMIKLNSINFIEFTIMQLRLFLKILSKAVIQIPSFILDFIIEIIQLPCVENQRTLCKTTFFEDASYMSQFFSSKANQIQRLFESPEDVQELQELQNKILVAVMSVLEGNEDLIYKDLQNKLEISFLIDFLKSNLDILGVSSVNEMKKLLQKQEQTFNDQIIRVVNVCMIIKKIDHRYPESKWLRALNENIKTDKQEVKQILELLFSKIRKIEIVYEKNTMTIFYPSHPLFEFLSDHTKEKLLFSISRGTQREKILGLLEQKDILFYELEYNYKLNQMQIPITQKKIDILQLFTSVLSVVINLMMIVYYTVVVKGNSYFLHAEFYENLFIKFLTILQLFSQIILFIFYSFNRAPIILKKHQLRKGSKPVDEEQEETQISESSEKVNFTTFITQKATLCFKIFLKIMSYSMIIINGEDDLLLLMIMMILSFIGVFYRNYFFVLHLVEIFSRLSLLKNVFQAISYNAKQLLVVALLGVLFVYGFSVLTFNTYFDDIYPEINEEMDVCNSLITCMITLLTSGVIGNSMVQWDPVKFFFDMGFTVFFGLLFTNIISGIMIDTFAELRDQRQKIEEDTKNYCFICGVSRATLEKNNESFEDHTQDQHLVWNYIYYVYCLLQKDSTEYTGLEYWLYEKIMNDDIQWFPVQEGDDVGDVQDRLQTIQQQLHTIIDSIERKDNEEQ